MTAHRHVEAAGRVRIVVLANGRREQQSSCSCGLLLAVGHRFASRRGEAMTTGPTTDHEADQPQEDTP